jgi:hypothetical protein
MLFFGKKSVAETTLKVGYNGKKAENGLKKLKGTISSVMSLYAIKEISSYTFQLAKMGATAELVDKSMKKFAVDRGKNYEEMMMKLRKATTGLMADMELQQMAMQAMIGGVNFDDVVTSMEYVSKFAMTTGTDVASKMRTVMTGLARESAAFLDDVGIQVMGSKDVVADAMIQMKEKMSQFVVSEDDAIVKTTKMSISVKELSTTLGKKMALSLGIASKSLTSFFNEINEMLSISKLDKIKLEVADFDKQIDKLKSKNHLNPFNLIHLEILKADKKHAFDIMNSLIEEEDKILQEQRKKAQQKTYKVNFDLQTIETKKIENIENIEKKEKKEIIDSDQDISGTEKEAQEMLDMMAINDSKKKIQKEHLSYIEGIKRIHDQTMLSQSELAKQNIINNVNDEYAILIEKYQNNDEVLKDIDIIKKQEIEERQKVHEETLTSLSNDGAMARIDIAKTTYSQLATFMSTFQSFSNEITNQKIRNLEKENLSREQFTKRRESIIEKGKEKARELARFQQTMAVFQAIINTYTAGMQTYAQAPVFTKTIAMALTVAQGMLTVGKIQNQHFAQGSGTIGETQSYRSSDSIHAMIGKGERVISAPDNARNKEVLDAIANNTMSTNLSLKRFGTSSSGNVVNNFYSLTDEQLQRATNNNNRKNIIGEQI